MGLLAVAVAHKPVADTVAGTVVGTAADIVERRKLEPWELA